MLRNTGKSEIVFIFSFFPLKYLLIRESLKKKERRKTLKCGRRYDEQVSGEQWNYLFRSTGRLIW